MTESFQEEAQLQVNEDCEGGSTHFFPLEQLDPSQSSSNADYIFQLVNTGGPYTLGSCVCNITKYELTFSHVPNDVAVKDQYENPITFYLELDPETGNEIIVIYPSAMNDATLEIHVYFENAPELVSAGGLCVVDNLSGTGPQVIDKLAIHVDPVLVSYFETSTIMVHKWMIPTTMTSEYLGK